MRSVDLEGVILRWKKTTRAMKTHDQVYGRHLTEVLGRVPDAQLVHFQDPVEAAAFFCMLDILKKSCVGKAGIPGKDPEIWSQQPVLPDCIPGKEGNVSRT
jgi:hypothetical protein